MTGSPVVIDASIALRWLLPDRLNNACWALLDRTIQHGDVLTVPTLWVYEVVSGLTKAVQFGMVTPDEARQGFDQIFSIGANLTEPNETLSRRAFEWTLRLSCAAAYDSYYLALAETLSCPLWTADLRLFNASRAAKLDWVYWLEDLQN